MQINGNLDFKGVGKLLRPSLEVTDFPANPSVGEIVLKNDNLYVCVESGGLLFWVSLANDVALYRHDQTTPALEWTVDHQMNTDTVNVQVFDSNGQWVIPDSINCSQINRAIVSFSTPMAGTAIVTGNAGPLDVGSGSGGAIPAGGAGLVTVEW